MNGSSDGVCKRTLRKSHSKELMNTPKVSALASLLEELGGKRNTASRIVPRKTSRIELSSVLSRARDFLPEMEKADKDLKQRLADGQSRLVLDVESVEEGGPCIEMDVAVVPVEDGGSGSSSSVEEESDDEKTGKMMIKCDNMTKTFAFRLPLDRRSNKKSLLVEEIVA